MEYVTRHNKAGGLDTVLRTDLEPSSSSGRLEHSGAGQTSAHAAFVGTSRAMQRVRRQIESVAQLDVPVLILGENGTGRQTVARLIHELSSRSKFSFEKVTCDGFPEELLDAELFGHVDNGNGRAAHVARGKFERCSGGTILLEEISRSPLGLQAKILHVLQDREFFRKGGDSKIGIDVRVMASNHADIEQSIRDRHLRDDLFFLLGAFTIELPPLREHKEDIPLLLTCFMDRLAAQHNRPPKTFSPAILEACQEYEWPGNLRELENLVQRYLIMGSEFLTMHGLRARSDRLFLVSRELAGELKHAREVSVVAGAGEPGSGLKSLVRNLKGETEINAIRNALERTRWNRRKAALLLNISYRGLLYKIREYQLVPPHSS